MIRPAEVGDLVAIAAIYGDLIKAGAAILQPVPLNELEMAAHHAELVESGYPYLAALEGKQLLGFAYAGPYRSRPAYRSTVEDAVFVAPAAQHRGLGRALLHSLLRRLEELDFRQVVAVIAGGNNAASIRLHEREGYVHAGTLKSGAFVHESWVDCLLLQRSLGPGADTAPTR
jgi:L-amino acid N-acyltransferase YncA